MSPPTPPPVLRIVTAHTICLAVRGVLEERLPAWAAALDLPPGPRRWIMLPEAGAAPAEPTPFGVITSPGLVGEPVRRPGRYDATWRVAVAMMDRAGDHDATAARARTWAAAIRCALTAPPTSLGELGATVTWVSEDYAARPEREAARTLGGCAVGFDVYVPDTTPRAAPPTPAGPSVGVVASTELDLSATLPDGRHP